MMMMMMVMVLLGLGDSLCRCSLFSVALPGRRCGRGRYGNLWLPHYVPSGRLRGLGTLLTTGRALWQDGRLILGGTSATTR